MTRSYQLVGLTFSLKDNSSGYTTLRHALPEFLQLAVTYPNVLVERPNGNLAVSFMRLLEISQQELMRFVFYEAISTFLLGLPPLVDYAHDIECGPNFTYPGCQWVHALPAAFLQIIIQVNSRRARRRVYSDDWEALVERVLTWKSPHISDDLSTSERDTVDVARNILHEGWRHVLLIYIYMVGLSGSCYTCLAED
jgi:hypothetical protein